ATGRPHEDHDLAVANLQREVPDGNRLRVALADVVEHDQVAATATRPRDRSRCTPASTRSARIPMAATGTIPASTRPSVPVLRPMAVKIGWPRSLAPTAAPTVAMATIITVACRMPASTTGTASGSSTRVRT